MVSRRAQLVFLFLVVMALASQALAVIHTTHKTVAKPSKFKRTRAKVKNALWNPLFRPTHESMLVQNEQMHAMELPPIKNTDELEELKSNGALAPFEESDHLHIAKGLPMDRAFARPWTVDFVEDVAREYYEEFGVPLQLNSAVRTVQVQRKLRRHNGNAAPESGDIISSHLAGTTVDIQRGGLTKPQHQWLENYFANLKALGLIEPEEERRHYCFHVMVYQDYDKWRDQPAVAEGTP
ncbi:hypothetical protein Acid345_2577 [Candidatus Koribacter versatilis Ellin345]|uniref:Peptidase M15A C-terminal domain-containing protein n=1 Tax=Koribacter versatilis (strain Ellin345) TaxID=204669 RepID=Q1INH2_KORVE|nr:DUF5715 family protein [Candidatus Koribacter versatilis]ABF41578.1 hypothetical protein Acid345_2577 [Candidatus Koribacter versatilis Ellin345]